jgi:F-type H+-transporting ATPase subunit a
MTDKNINMFPNPTKIFFGISDYDLSLMIILLIFIGIYIFQDNFIVKKIMNKIYNIFLNMSNEQLGSASFAKFLMFLFLFILFGNILGIFNFFAINSYYITPIVLSSIVFITSLIFLFLENGIHFYRPFIPSSVPIILKPFIGLLELFSFLMKPITLAVRLLLNVAIGHLLIHILSTIDIPGLNIILTLIISIVECGTSFLQAYLFTVFTTTMIRSVKENH